MRWKNEYRQYTHWMLYTQNNTAQHSREQHKMRSNNNKISSSNEKYANRSLKTLCVHVRKRKREQKRRKKQQIQEYYFSTLRVRKRKLSTVWIYFVSSCCSVVAVCVFFFIALLFIFFLVVQAIHTHNIVKCNTYAHTHTGDTDSAHIFRFVCNKCLLYNMFFHRTSQKNIIYIC